MGKQKDVILEIRNLTKTFPGVVANRDVDLDIERGEVHTLLGENGAGKSTLMKAIYGIYGMDSGTVMYNGNPLDAKSPKDAIAVGIGMIHQHFLLVQGFTVLENIVMGLKAEKGIHLDLDKHRTHVEEIVERFDIRLDSDEKVGNLSVGMQQKVEIVKVLYRNAKFLILDEPTSVLTPQESQGLFGIIGRLKKEGATVIFISHKLDEVIQISDRITVLRDGEVVETVVNKDLSKDDLSAMMVGREVTLEVDTPEVEFGPIGLELDKVSMVNQFGKTVLNDVSFSIRQGEILGIAGVDGNGQEELAQAIWGTQKVSSGSIKLHGSSIDDLSTRKRMDMNMAYIPADRKKEGLIGTFQVSENMVLDSYYKPHFIKGLGQDFGAIRDYSERLVEEYNVKTPALSVWAGNLSGGNQQKLILSRAIEGNNDVFIVAQPTWGLDIGAIEFVYKKICELKEAGKTILLISTDLEEVRSLSDRMCVIFEGEVSETFRVQDKQVAEIGLLMAGGKRGEE
jgi:simple sugar transport system ATP-binding protein